MVIVKHANPCGVGRRRRPGEAYEKRSAAIRCRRIGGIVAVNRPLDEKAARRSPASSPRWSSRRTRMKPPLRCSARSQPASAVDGRPRRCRRPGRSRGSGRRRAAGAGARRRRDRAADCQVVTKRAPSEREMADLPLRLPRCQARQVERHRLREGRGHGRHRGRSDEPRRFRRIAAMKAGRCGEGRRPRGAAHARVGRGFGRLLPLRRRAVRRGRGGRDRGDPQPGGSLRDDEEVIAAADENGLAMVFTDIRHFRH